MSAPLRVVLLEHPHPGGPGGDLFARLLAMREAGYRRRHEEFRVAADRYDPVSTHVVVCREDGTTLAPLLAFRTTLARDCAAAGLPLPVAGFVERPDTAAHAGAVAAELERCRASGRQVAYLGLWTVDPALRTDRRLFRDVWALNAALFVGMVRDGGIGQMLVTALPSQGTDRLLGRYGMRVMEADGAPLPRLDVPHIPGETAVLMHLPALSPEALAEAETGRRSWEERIVVAGRAARRMRRAA